MAKLTGLPPIEAPAARVLVLGSMPGVVSLREQQYYAHPQNAFWPPMEALFGVGADLPYARRTAALARAGVALWDVLHRCEREGSLDGDIRAAEPNDFAGFLARHPRVDDVFCNGATAHGLFTRRVLGTLGARGEALTVHRLPSTSPAHTIPRARKLEAWRAVADAIEAASGARGRGR